MEFWGWLSQNCFNLFGSAGVAGLWFTVVSLRDETKATRDANLLTLTSNHRELGKVYLDNRDLLKRVYNASANTKKQPVTMAEEVYINMKIQQLNSAYYMMRDQLVVKVEGMRRDVSEFLSLPVPREAWEKIKVFQNDDFVAFVESCLNWK